MIGDARRASAQKGEKLLAACRDGIAAVLRNPADLELRPMVERRRFGNLLPHLILLLGVAIVAFPVYLCFVGSTHEQSVIANGQMPITPGAPVLRDLLQDASSSARAAPRASRSARCCSTASSWRCVIAVGKIAISIISAYAVVYFRFPFRMTAFWLIFMTLMLPVEVRIYPDLQDRRRPATCSIPTPA